jgi:ferredoxin
VTFVITEPCIDTKDQACVEVCPVDCIHFEEAEDRMLYIDPAECIDCGACQPACPVSAIFPEGDVPADQAHFTEINALWYQDRAAARARVGGGGGEAAAPAAADAPATEAPAAEAPPAEASTNGGDGTEAATQVPAAEAEPAAAGEPAPAAAASTAAVVDPAYIERVTQVPASAGAHAPAVSTYNLPSPAGFITLALFVISFVALWVAPGPKLLEIEGVEIGATIVLLTPIAIIFALYFIVTQARVLSLFSAHHDVPTDHWRERLAVFRRNEESRRYLLVEAVEAIAGQRFAFPSDEYPDLRTYVNLPDPEFGVEPRGTGEKLFPDIVTVSYPGNHPVAIAQVETKETVSYDQATWVWARLENRQCPLYLYVPAGSVKRAKRFARLAGLKNVRWRTWRWGPNGMTVREM